MTTPSITPDLCKYQPHGGDQPSVTAAMVDAGLGVLRASGAVENPLAADRLLVEAIFNAMLARR